MVRSVGFVAAVAVVLAALVIATQTVGLAAGQAAVIAQPSVAIGCLRRQAPRSAEGATARVRYVVTDTRSDPPTTYVLEGDRDMLGPHVGHTVEVTGALRRGVAGALTLKVVRLTYLAGSCPAGSRP